jgi:hypothetical protein
MPRPSSGYLNAAGQKIPGTNDVVGRFKDHTALMAWAYNQGKAGLPRYERSTLDIGSAVHKMAELDLLDAQLPLGAEPHRDGEHSLPGVPRVATAMSGPPAGARGLDGLRKVSVRTVFSLPA